MAYYTVSHILSKVPIQEVDDQLFDFIFLDKGKAPAVDSAKAMKHEFLYWYPLDFRNSGKDLVQNHLTFFLFNHIAIFPKEMWPKSIGVNGWVRVEGEKMSKSLGNMIPLTELEEKFGADASRMAILSGGEGLDDPNWDNSFAKSIGVKLEQLSEFVEKNYGKGGEEKKEIDNWMDNQLNQIIADTENAMEKTLFRTSIQKSYFDSQRALRWYLRRTKSPNKDTMNRAIETQLLLLSPFAPFICEELWEKIGKKEIISKAQWPKAIKVDYKGNEELIEKIIEDINNIQKFVKIKPNKAYLYTIPDEKKDLEEATEFLKKDLGLEIKVFANNEKNIHDPQGKSKKAKPGKPAILLE